MTLSALTRRTFLLVAGLCFGLLMVSTAIAGDTVPLKGKFEGVGIDFSGTFTHLGKFTGVFGAPTVWTAANEDTVTNQTVSFVLIEEVAPWIFVYEQVIVITGGTGRFENATGSAEVVGLIDFNSGAFDGVLDGEISRPNSGG